FAMQEVGNSIWKRVLRKEVPKENALSVFQEFVRAVLDDGIVDLVRLEADLLYASLKLAVEERITIYDSAFIELARRNKWGLITSDDKQRDISKKCYATIHVTYIK
ncbi:MAG: type II toxin-antitoxin system VapC family toxin, partial [Nitrososphaerales archaeon]